MLYSCTHMATVGVKGLMFSVEYQRWIVIVSARVQESGVEIAGIENAGPEMKDQKDKRPDSAKMVNGSRYYRALESVSIASALSSALTIYPCQIRVHQTQTVLNSNFSQLRRRSGGRPQRTVTCQL